MHGQSHGGDRYRHRVEMDFSVNTNPLGMPTFVRRAMEGALDGSPAPSLEWYPDPACERLRAALAACHRLETGEILCGNGASELIFAFARGLGRGRRALLPVPSFGEYERALQAARIPVTYYGLRQEDQFAVTEALLEQLTGEIGLLFLCQPGNPVGSLMPDGLLRQILERCLERGIYVLLDTCFLELAAGEDEAEGVMARQGQADREAEEKSNWSARREWELAKRIDAFPNVVILRAFTKLYAIPGLRLGYCMCSDERVLEAMGAQIPCWSVSGPAQLAGVAILENEDRIDYISQSRVLIGQERKFLALGLEALGFRLLPGKANFLCFHSRADAPHSLGNLQGALLKRGILIRDCGSFRGMGDGWYRIAVRPPKENAALLAALRMLQG